MTDDGSETGQGLRIFFNNVIPAYGYCMVAGLRIFLKKFEAMRLYYLALFAVLAVRANAQNEFASARFSDAFKKLYADAPKGFAAYKGIKLRTMGSLINIHKNLNPLPGTDSAIISIPVAMGNPSCTHYFEPSTTLAAAQQREQSLAISVKAAAGKMLYEKKMVDTLGRFIFYRTQLYNKPGGSVFDIDLETYVVLERGRYYLGLVIYGKTPPPTPTGKSKLPAETDLQGKVNNLFAALQGRFAAEKGLQKEKTQYYTTYETVSKLFGQTGTVKERTYETSISFSLNGQQLDGPDEAKQIYEKLKAAFTATGRCRFNPETIEGTRTWLFAMDANNNAVKSKFSLVLEYYADGYNPSVSLLLTAK